MPPTCHPSPFATPHFLSTILHTIGLIELPINLLGTYIIVCKAPRQMCSVKMPMLNLHFWVFSLDIYLTLLTIPFVLFPEIAGFPMGILKELGVGTSVQIHVGLTIMGFALVSFLSVYANRYFVLSGSVSTSRRRFRIGYIGMAYFLAGTFMIPFTMMVPEQESAKVAVLEHLPCLPATITNTTTIFVFTLDFTPIFLTALTLATLAISLIAFFLLSTIYLLFQQKVFLSRSTLRLQRKFLFGLTVQTTIPSVVFSPVLYWAVMITGDYYNQAFNNGVLMVFSIHGVLSTSAMLSIHEPYRIAVLSILIPRYNEQRGIGSVVSSTTRKMT